jgi:hypothetical protein
MGKRRNEKVVVVNTIEPALASRVFRWGSLGTKPAVPYNVANNFPQKKLRRCSVQVTGPGKSYLKKARAVKGVLFIPNKTVQVQILCMEHKSKVWKVGMDFEIHPKYLRLAEGFRKDDNE